jgi:hypothetical protein
MKEFENKSNRTKWSHTFIPYITRGFHLVYVCSITMVLTNQKVVQDEIF